jgi:glyoxylase-like metal-dependent hydrolase (beta-lactamase superfamily II)
MQLIFEQIAVGGDRNYAYLLGDRTARTGVFIDPSYSPETLSHRARVQGLSITHVINTHGHPDHINGNDVACAQTGAKVAAFEFSTLNRPEIAIPDGGEIAVGGLRLRCLHVPGHCSDHLTLYEPTWKLLVTGDLLFVGKVGGTGNDADGRTEWASLQKVLASVPDDATVWPGHDYGVRPSSTIALERATNPFLRCKNVDEFLALKRDWAKTKLQLGLK